ncbi:hypothetical protein D1AOALGA4SA_8174 [Olavius algarvensis Delta 1 endosymbiont]|nr:hypothetical protein D1AOALGA4SA_8174 [Olavius algarvensis Delta 1 endosymbiont]
MIVKYRISVYKFFLVDAGEIMLFFPFPTFADTVNYPQRHAPRPLPFAPDR